MKPCTRTSCYEQPRTESLPLVYIPLADGPGRNISCHLANTIFGFRTQDTARRAAYVGALVAHSWRRLRNMLVWSTHWKVLEDSSCGAELPLCW